ncbi:MAG TPA: hypothetical protein VFP40_02885 [Terriglobales bacterium]|nr:hypothetical protein [Terriglobales bacterium]
MIGFLSRGLGGADSLGLFWVLDGERATVLLAVWMVAIGVFVTTNLADRFLWVPVLLGLMGILSCMFIFALPAMLTLGINVATLLLFLLALELLKRHHTTAALVKHHRS